MHAVRDCIYTWDNTALLVHAKSWSRNSEISRWSMNSRTRTLHVWESIFVDTSNEGIRNFERKSLAREEQSGFRVCLWRAVSSVEEFAGRVQVAALTRKLYSLPRISCVIFFSFFFHLVCLPVTHSTITLKIMNIERNRYVKLKHVKHVMCPSKTHTKVLCFIFNSLENSQRRSFLLEHKCFVLYDFCVRFLCLNNYKIHKEGKAIDDTKRGRYKHMFKV